jgi:hypothetical protein
VQFMTAAAHVMSSFTNTDCVKDHPQICESIAQALAAASAFVSLTAFDTNAATTKQSA